MRLLFECTAVERRAVIRHGDRGSVREETVNVLLEPQYGLDSTHPNRALWGRGVAIGAVRLSELPASQAAVFVLHKVYAVEVTVEEVPT